MVGPCGQWEPVVLKALGLEMFLLIQLLSGSNSGFWLSPPQLFSFFSSFSFYKQSFIPSLAIYCPAVSAMDMLVLPK